MSVFPRAALRHQPALLLAAGTLKSAAKPAPRSQWTRCYSSSGLGRSSPPRGRRLVRFVTVSAVLGCAWAYWNMDDKDKEMLMKKVYVIYTGDDPRGPVLPQKAEVLLEEPRKRADSKEGNRELVSSQHVQVKNSLEHPGLYAWGSNAGGVAAPDSDEPVIKTPRRIPYFDGQLLRDVKLDRQFGAAITERGDLVQWGAAFSPASCAPTVTLRGKDIVKIAVSQDRILALSSGGFVYSIPVARADQVAMASASGAKPARSSLSWIPFWSSDPSQITYRNIQPEGLGWGEKVIDVRSGLEHALMLTNNGRVFAAASSSESFPSRGQMGIPGLTWETRAPGPYDKPYEIKDLKGVVIKEIAAGDRHSLALDVQGNVFVFGDNSLGQLGFHPTAESPHVQAPVHLPFDKLYKNTDLRPRATSVAAGGANSYFTIDATQGSAASLRGGIFGFTTSSTNTAAPPQSPGPGVVADTWACGDGSHGGLGTGRWTHVSEAPSKIKALSGLSEFDEASGKAVPIRLAHISAGATHTAAVMNNAARAATPDKLATENDTNWGADIVFFGGNEHYQLGTGKRNNSSTPVHLRPLDGASSSSVSSGRESAGKKANDDLTQVHRLQVTPRTTVRLATADGGKGRKVSMEQRVECGRHVTAVYSGV